MITSIPSEGHPRRQQTLNNNNTFDDDYEPARPQMKNTHPQQRAENFNNTQSTVYDNFDNEVYDMQAPNFQGSRQSSSIGNVNRSTRMMA